MPSTQKPNALRWGFTSIICWILAAFRLTCLLGASWEKLRLPGHAIRRRCTKCFRSSSWFLKRKLRWVPERCGRCLLRRLAGTGRLRGNNRCSMCGQEVYDLFFTLPNRLCRCGTCEDKSRKLSWVQARKLNSPSLICQIESLK